MWRLMTRVVKIPLLAITLVWILWFVCMQNTALAETANNATSQAQTLAAENKPRASIDLTKTVGIIPNRCATTEIIVVSAGTPLYYCYVVQNTGNITLTTHTLQDSLYDHPLKDHVAYTLTPWPSLDSIVTLIVTGSNGVQQTTISTGTWIAATADGITTTASDSTTTLVPLLRVTETVGINAHSCATTKKIDVLPGTKITYCYTVYNAGKVTLRLHNAVDSRRSIQKNSFSLNLPPGAINRITVTVPVTQTTTNVITWTGYVTDVTGVFTVVTDSATVNTPAITLRATVGTNPKSCASSTSITVTAGAEVAYCYTVTNTGGVTLTRHEISDSIAVTTQNHLLPPGDSHALGITNAVTQTEVDKVKWTAYGTSPMVATSSSQVTVTVVYTLAVFVFYDVDASGTFSELERGLPGIRLRLQQSSGNVFTTTTNAFGKAAFSAVVAGPYTVTVDQTSLPAGFTLTMGRNPYTSAVAWAKTDLSLGYTSPPDYNSDCDAIPDRLEGPNDDNNNGIPNYLDANCVYLPSIQR